jgi:cytochrome c556
MKSAAFRYGFAAIALAICPVTFAADEDVIQYREHIMKSLNEHAGALGQMLSGAVPKDNATAHLEAIALIASTALKAFEPKVPGGEAKSQVWSQWDDFAKRMNDFTQRTSQAAQLAKTKGADEALANILDVLTCKSCHDTYRAEHK